MNNNVKFEFGESRSFSNRLLHFLEVNNYHILPNYTFKRSFDEEILERENIKEIKELEDYAYYCLTNLEEVIKVNTPIVKSVIERAEEIERIYNNNLQEDEDVTELELVELIIEMKEMLKEKEDKITYEHTYSEEFDITTIVKTTETDKEIITEISGFYFGKPSEYEIELFKDRGVISVIEK